MELREIEILTSDWWVFEKELKRRGWQFFKKANFWNSRYTKYHFICTEYQYRNLVDFLVKNDI